MSHEVFIDRLAALVEQACRETGHTPLYMDVRFGHDSSTKHLEGLLLDVYRVLLKIHPTHPAVERVREFLLDTNGPHRDRSSPRSSE